MISLKKIDEQLIFIDSLDSDSDLVASAVQLDENGTAFHAGLVIYHNNEYQLFHYTGSDIEFANTFDDKKPIYCKKLDIIQEFEVINFLANCEIIAEECKPEYGLVFDGAFFKNGAYYTESGLSFITTCVGFCLFTIKSFLLNTDYLFLDDWDSDTAKDFRISYTSIFDLTLSRIEASNPVIKDKLVKKYVKRITPGEFASAGFYNNLPIKKVDIDDILDNVNYILKRKIAS